MDPKTKAGSRQGQLEMNDKDGLGPSQHAYVVSQPGNKLNFSFLVELPRAPPLPHKQCWGYFLGRLAITFLFFTPSALTSKRRHTQHCFGGVGEGRGGGKS